ncbi:hypothetical protein [Defluviitalea raffinosedens]|jgi:hypothetical protein|uniref:DUF2508 family protein n=1 Tax=Defluviitalea raffinosedens TaxID=1450156 RepID=A0A7C8LCG6_9FIRM|nr:hypothetical protein [Defluviitalea raffinosedens]KAE9634401.1 hypothetical protein GND95_06935 [Defluviitalea raffinosedens]MBM7684809.1 hypothetical protein [Defluviitalea raffinosedens]MBZ4668285.1 hypothetical protein [Defluviitaleaceae bacterium]HHW67044.1 hypothetical protein [Candidatus Epulonipiscium sp.]
MDLRTQWSSQYVHLDDQCLLSEIDKVKKDVESTQKWIEELENKKDSVEYLHKKMAKLAFGFAREKHQILSQEAHRRGLIS